ncbi:MAG: DUF58 domain-containing protein [Candidatus Margulisiibacteriota bacterium]
MISADLLKKVRAIEIKTRLLVSSTFTGEYHSVFRGQGMRFAEVRDYHPGDDVRFIDWNVTAKMGSPFVKVFEEERELTVMLAVDVSASHRFGTAAQTKADLITELAAVLGFSAVQNKDCVGLCLFSDRIEAYVPPKKGKDHMLRLLRDLMSLRPKSKKTSLKIGLTQILKRLRKKAIVFVISDFLDTGYETVLKQLSVKHDLIPLVIQDGLELAFPNVGPLRLQDAETGQTQVVDTALVSVRDAFAKAAEQRAAELDYFFKQWSIKPIRITTGESYVGALNRYFRQRMKVL